jgi:hypothetical protein
MLSADMMNVWITWPCMPTCYGKAMDIVVIRVKLSRVSYELKLERKITYLTGMSADGKSALIDALNQAISLGYPLEGDFPPSSIALHIPASRAKIETGDTKLFIIDMDTVELDRNMSRAINSAEARFLLMGRDIASSVPVHYMSVLSLSTDSNGLHRGVGVYGGRVRKGLRLDLPSIVEDSGGGFEFYKALYNDAALGTFIDTAGGYGSIPKKVNALLKQAEEVQVIADASTFGAVIGDIIDLSRVVCFLPECVEQVFLKCPMFNQNYDEIFREDMLKHKSSEAFYMGCGIWKQTKHSQSEGHQLKAEKVYGI